MKITSQIQAKNLELRTQPCLLDGAIILDNPKIMAYRYATDYTGNFLFRFQPIPTKNETVFANRNGFQNIPEVIVEEPESEIQKEDEDQQFSGKLQNMKNRVEQLHLKQTSLNENSNKEVTISLDTLCNSCKFTDSRYRRRNVNHTK